MNENAEAEQWRRLEELFFYAAELNPAEQIAFLNQTCDGDTTLRRELEAMLSADHKTLDELRQPVEQAAQEMLFEADDTGRIGPYRILRLLGTGGMGTVYLASRDDAQYEHRVAIKTLRAGFSHDPEMQSRFRAERQILANLQHPNIARLFDGGITADGTPYLVMEYIDGVTLDAYCETHRLALDERLKMFQSVCAAVDYAHRNLVVHRDMKPANILVTSDGTPTLLDFGIAKLLDADQTGAAVDATQFTSRLLTPEYASPEQIRGETITTATDVYALGVLLYVMLTGQRPFSGSSANPLETAQIVCEREPERPSAVAGRRMRNAAGGEQRLALPEARKLRGDLDNIVLKAMSKEPARRYASVAQLSEDVQRHRDGYPVLAVREHMLRRTGKFLRRHIAGAALTAVIVLLILGFGIGMAILAGRATREARRAQREAQFLTSIFQAAAPDVARGRTITARELLDKGVVRIDHELAGDPQLQGSMLENMGQAYLGLGLYDQARPLLKRAVQLQRSSGESSLNYAATLSSLATAYRLQGNYRQAEPLFRQALTIDRRKAGMRSPITADTMSGLGENLYLEEKNAEAETMLRRSLAIYRQRDADAAGDTKNYLALVLERRGDFPDAAQLLRQALATDRKKLGADSPAYAISLHNFAGAQIDMGDLSGAESTERASLAIFQKVLGKDHPDTTYSLNNLGWILLAKGDWRAAEPVLAQNLAINRKQLPNINPVVANAVGNWGRVLQEKGDYSGAEKSYRQAMDILDRSGRRRSFLMAKLMVYSGMVDLDRGQLAGARKSMGGAYALQVKLGSGDTPQSAATLVSLAEVQSFAGDTAGAETSLRHALEIQRQHYPSTHPIVIETEVRLGEVETARGRYNQAEPLLRQADHAAHHPTFPLFAWQVAEADRSLAACLAAQGQTSEANTLFLQSHSALKNDPDAPRRQFLLQRSPEFRLVAANPRRKIERP